MFKWSLLITNRIRFITSDPLLAITHLNDSHGISIINFKQILPYFNEYINYAAERINDGLQFGKIENTTNRLLLGHEQDDLDKTIRNGLRELKLVKQINHSNIS